MKKGYIFILLFILIITGCATGAESPENPSVNNSASEPDKNQEADSGSEAEGEEGNNLGGTELPGYKDETSEKDTGTYEAELASMTLEQKIGQLIIAGFSGTQLAAEEAQFIASGQIGGVILFGPNVENKHQLLKLINDIKASNPEGNKPLFISVDEEGGRVSRLPDGKTEFPSALVIGEQDDAKLSEEVGRVIGEEVGAFGFNVDYAPVLDIYSNPDNKVIGNRAFGTTAEEVSTHGIATMKGLQRAGIISVVKHFPGHGDTVVDSHESLPVVDKTKAELEKLELVPFRKAIKEGADMMMVAHIQYPGIDSSGKPASLSPVMITEILREELHYDGVVVTDDLEMGAIEKNYGSGEAAVMALEAGADVVLFGHTPEKASEAYSAIQTAVEEGRMSESEVDKHVLRILKLKDKYELSDKNLSAEALKKFGSEEHKQIADQIR
ncbi:beta-N-acetylhexosaminidase [Paenibacillus sp. Marseille-Q4541]|uniref:beta-N-acetylhexosaminidase n=1 Tax=Paenibacillus sp. Marseille-Q4541 TaxID=2831522 RepID=UPI001BA661AD|nr:beta-N-acetylhexosaminidase [Paenibacillus sp. Marseille-Q4541]